MLWGGLGQLAAQQGRLATLTREGSELLAGGQLDEALSRFRGALDLKPDDPALAFNVGLTLFQLGRFGESLSPLELAVAHPPSALQARFMRGVVHFQRGDFDAAAPELEAARAHAQLGEQALYMLVQIYRAGGDVEPAQAAFVDLQERYPESAFYHQLMGAAYDAEGLHSEALREFEAARRKDPNMPDIAFAIGFMHFKRRAHRQAASWMARELAARPCHAKAHYYLGEIKAAAGDVEEAESRYRQAIRCASGHAAGYAGLGGLLLKQGRYAEAADMLQEAVSLDSRSADAYYSLGRALLRLGRQQEAQAAFRRVEELHAAKHTTARRALGSPELLAQPDAANR